VDALLVSWRDNTPIKRCLTVLSVYEGERGLKTRVGYERGNGETYSHGGDLII
jgi:hypothetical protein